MQVLDILEEVLRILRLRSVRIDGGTAAIKRQGIIDDFSSDTVSIERDCIGGTGHDVLCE